MIMSGFDMVGNHSGMVSVSRVSVSASLYMAIFPVTQYLRVSAI